jgi:lipopolysaccharide biosynthesis glycosyltransferase
MTSKNAIVACCDKNMIAGACVALLSAKEHLGSVHADLILIARDLPEEDRKAITIFEAKHGIAFKQIHLESAALEKAVTNYGATTLRLGLDGFLSADYDRVLYLDSDVLAIDDISFLFTAELGDNAIAAVPDLVKNIPLNVKRMESLGLSFGNYFNAGVLLFNWKTCLECNLFAKAREAISGPRLRFLDQDALNFACENKWLRLPVGYNFIAPFHARLHLHPRIVHFTGGGKGRKPWEPGSIGLHHSYRASYKSALEGTPWNTFVKPAIWKDRVVGEFRSKIEALRRYSTVLDYLKRHKVV